MGTAASVSSSLRTAVSRATARVALQRAALIVEAEAKREAPVKSGLLRRSITNRVVSDTRAEIGTNAKYAWSVHQGAPPHTIMARKAKALFWKGARHPVKSVRHPGNRPNPFMRRAADNSRARVQAELSSVYGAALAKVR